MSETLVHVTVDGHVSSNPGILGGTPVFSGTRVPVTALFDYLADGLSVDYFLETFPTVARKQVVAVLRQGNEWIARGLGQ